MRVRGFSDLDGARRAGFESAANMGLMVASIVGAVSDGNRNGCFVEVPPRAARWGVHETDRPTLFLEIKPRS